MVKRFRDGILVCPPCANGDHSHHAGYDCKNEIKTTVENAIGVEFDSVSQCLCLNNAGYYPKHDEKSYLIYDTAW